ncbi:MAG: response regulator [Thermoanaerobaculales bacterium]
MDPEFADLIPLFVAEARGRVERLLTLAAAVESEPQAVTEARRELHTLKGAGRMLRLGPLAELCHATEGALQAVRPGVGSLLLRAVDAIAATIEAIGRDEVAEVDAELLRTLAVPAARSAPVEADSAAPAATAAPPPRLALVDEVRLEAKAVDAMADRATQLRILSLGAVQSVVRLNELARLAEDAVHEAQPAQALAVLATSLRRLGVEIEAGQKRLHRTAEQQLEALLALQVQPLRGFLLSLARHARELARSLGREVEVELRGEDTRLDRRIAQELEDALIHLIRNAVDHGIEATEAREKVGKPRIGRIRLEASTAGSRVRLSVTDDGAGIDPARVSDSALAAGLIDAERATTLSREDALRLLFTPGFSTRSEVSEVSGRGVGLDVVAGTAGRVGGSATIDSQPGRGTTVTIEVPMARRGEQVLLVRVGSLRLALPAGAVRRVHRLREDAIVERDRRFLARLGDRLVPFVPLAKALGEPSATTSLLLQGEHAGQALAVAVDAVEGAEEVLVRPIARAAAGVAFLDGVALLASGQPLGVLSPKALAQAEMGRPMSAPALRTTPKKLRVLLVDDSLVTREMERRLLEEMGFDVAAVGDAAEALTQLGEQVFDCMVTDVEMPGMDGFELVRHLRGIPAFARLPVVVVSTHDRPEDRLAGLEAGADAYLSKQGLDSTELAGLVRRLGGR